MKIKQKIITILMMMTLAIIIFAGTVSAGTVSTGVSASTVTVGNQVKLTVSFGEQVKGAQFQLNYDKSKLDYVSASAGQLGSAGTYVYADLTGGQMTIGSVTFTFKAKATGTAAFSISNIVLPVSYTTASTSSSVNIQAAKNNTTTTKPKPTTNTNTKPTEPETPLDKTELYTFIQSMTDLVETDYTPESWKAVQDAISKVESATTNEAYQEAKAGLNLDVLVPEVFEKEELNRVLRMLLGKIEKDYTKESWKELQDAIDIADTTKLKSEYDKVKDKLTVNNLILEEEKSFWGELVQRMQEDPLVLGLVIAIGVLVLLFIIILALYMRSRREPDFGPERARRLK